MKGYKGFDKDLKCRGKQYEIGKTYEEETAVLCESGMHFCECPLDCFAFYPPSSSSRYCVVEAEESECDPDCGDTKHVTKKLTVVKEISVLELAEAAVRQANGESVTGYRGAATSTGYCGAATSTGYFSAAMSTGHYSAAKAEGLESFAIAAGFECKAAGGLVGCWLFLVERDAQGHILGAVAVKVDGEKIMPGVFYTLRGGEIAEAG